MAPFEHYIDTVSLPKFSEETFDIVHIIRTMLIVGQWQGGTGDLAYANIYGGVCLC
jgi:hypothetical protein